MDANTGQVQGVAPAPSSASDPHAEFKRFDSYPWVRDRSFLQGLMAMLGPSFNNSNDGFVRQKALSTTLQARIWWYKSRFNLDIDRIAYESYSLTNSSTCPDGAILTRLEEIRERMGLGSASSASSASQGDAQDKPPIPAWQLNAPKVDLSKKADDGSNHANSGDGAPYPENFQALVEAVMLGKPIPGIKEIPNTIERPPGVTPFGKMKAPPKPWEKNLPAETLAQTSVFGNVVDKEFPPLPPETDSGDSGAAATVTTTATAEESSAQPTQ